MQYQIADGRLITSLSREELINETITNIIAAWREDRS